MSRGPERRADDRPMALIEVYADVGCPFAHVGLRWLLRRTAARRSDDVAVRVRSWPLELVNGRPLDPGDVADHVRDLRAQVAPDLFARLDPATFPRTTLPALALAAAAYRHGDRTGWEVSLSLRHALFEEGRDVSRPEVLAELARAHGVDTPSPLDEEAVVVDWRDGASRGVKGSPHFFCSDRDVLCPSLEISRGDEGQLRIGRSVERLDAFLAECLGGPGPS